MGGSIHWPARFLSAEKPNPLPRSPDWSAELTSSKSDHFEDKAQNCPVSDLTRPRPGLTSLRAAWLDSEALTPTETVRIEAAGIRRAIALPPAITSHQQPDHDQQRKHDHPTEYRSQFTKQVSHVDPHFLGRRRVSLDPERYIVPLAQSQLT